MAETQMSFLNVKLPPGLAGDMALHAETTKISPSTAGGRFSADAGDPGLATPLQLFPVPWGRK